MLLLLSCTQDYDLIEPVDVDPGDVTDCDFTQVEDTEDFYEYDCNPVFTTSGEEWAPSVSSTTFNVTNVMGHPFYQMWYVGIDNSDGWGDYGVGYAVSSNGTDWDPHPDNPLWTAPENQGAWNASAIDALQAVWDPDEERYMMIYQGYNIPDVIWKMGVSTSDDGTDWEHYDPPLDMAQGSGDVTTWCWPLGLELGSIIGYSGYLAGGNNTCAVYQLDAGGPESWTTSSTLVLPIGSSGEWDDTGVISMDIAWLDGTAYLFYVGYGAWIVQGAYLETSEQFLGWATSDDGQDWKKQGMVPLHKTSSGEVRAVNAHTVGQRIHLWVTDEYEDGGGDTQTGVGLFLFDPEREGGER